MTKTRVWVVAANVMLLSVSYSSAGIVAFNGVATTNLPYSEAGLTFSNLPGGDNLIVAGGADGHLLGGTNTLPIHVRVTGAERFNLSALDIEGISRTWRIESSSGAVFNVGATGTINFIGLTGWTNLTSFDIIHDPPQANGSIRVDNIVFTSVPEPSAVVLTILAASCFLFLRR
jgi:hypothetical protein